MGRASFLVIYRARRFTLSGWQSRALSTRLALHPLLTGNVNSAVSRLVAQYADLCNVFGDPDTVAHKYAVLRRHCARLGRAYDAITRSNHVTLLIAADERALAAKKQRYGADHDLVGTPEAIVEGLQRYARSGSQYVTVELPDAAEIEPLVLLGETVVPVIAGF